MQHWHTLSIEQIEKELDTSVKYGLGLDHVAEKTEKYGKNELKQPKGPSFFTRFMAQLKEFLIVILIIAAVISAIFGEWVDSAVILFIVLLNAAIGVYQEGKAEKALFELKKISTSTAKVLRDGKIVTINSVDVVPGDIILVEAGDMVPADARLFEVHELSMLESALTGESVPVFKNIEIIEKVDTQTGDQTNMIFSSTLVANGRGMAIVTSTGMDSQLGRIAALLMQEEEKQTPLQKKLAELGKILGIIAMVICAIIFILGILQGQKLFFMFMTAVSLAVAAVPEGLPAIVTVVLSIGVSKMAKKNAIIRNLPAVETLGSASVICTDKTGTLTLNKMTAVKAYVGGEYFNVSLENKEKLTRPMCFFSLCTDAIEDIKDGKTVYNGDPTETALAYGANTLGFSKTALEQYYTRVHEIPFDSERKLMTTVYKQGEKLYVITKGAPDVLLSKCDKAEENGDKLLNLEMHDKIMNAVDEMSEQALRVLAVAIKEIDNLQDVSKEKLENDLTFVALVGLIDPPRSEVKDSVAQCKSAGITTIMITGDYVKTAKTIAAELGIYEEGNLCISGEQLDKMSDKELAENISKCTVFARVSPEHKMRIVAALQKSGKISAMTGDGINDAPALKASDIGCAMGISGTEVAKGAADMVLTDDNFSTIVLAVKEGRGIYANIKRTVSYLLSCNLGEVFTVLFSIIFGWSTPLLPIQLLWVNLVTDSLPAIALGMEPIDDSIMKNKPRPVKESIFAGKSGVLIVLYGIVISIITLFAYYIGLKQSQELGRTMAFATLAFSQISQAINLRSNRSIFKMKFLSNKMMNYTLVITAVISFAVLLIPVLAGIFSVVSMSLIQWVIVLALAIVPLIVGELVKE